MTALLLGLLGFPGAAPAAEGAPVETRGIPFSTADLGWLALAAMLLLVLSLLLQAIARHRRRGATAPVNVAPQRTEP